MKRKATAKCEKPRTRGEAVILFIEKFCRVPEGELLGQPVKLEPFEKDFIFRTYDNAAHTELAILSTAKKNGKTTFIACLVLVHVVGPRAVQNSQVVSGAMSREQSGLVFDYAAKMVRLNPELDQRVRIVPSRKRLIGLLCNVEYRALAADGKRIHGISPVVAILDEVGQVKGPRSEFVDAIQSSQGAYERALLLVISTQAASDTDMLSLWIDEARHGENPHTVLALHEAPKDCALDDRVAWRAANPALGVFRSLSDMEKQATKAKQMPSFAPTFRNLHLNQRVESTSPFVSHDVWTKGDRDMVPPEGLHDCWSGLDLSAVNDLCALVWAWEAADQWNIGARFWAPEAGVLERSRRDHVPYDVWAQQGYLRLTPGATVDYDFVAAEVLEWSSEWGGRLRGMAFDRWRIDVFKAALSRQDAPPAFIELLRPFGQGFRDMGPALDVLERQLLSNRVAHAANPVLRMCAANATTLMDPAGNRKFNKMKSTGRIDGMVALAMAFGSMPLVVTQPPKFQLFAI